MEQLQEPVEGAGAQVSEPVKDVSEESVSEKTFSQVEVTNQISEALKAEEVKWQSRKDTEFSELQNKAVELENKAKMSEIVAQEQREIDQWGDTQEVKDFQKARRAHAEQVNADRAERQKTETLANQINLTNRMIKAKEVATAHPGMDAQDLMRCQTPEEMQGLVDIFDKIKASLTGSQKVDSSVPSAPGVNLKDMSPRDLIRLGITQEQ